MHIHFILHESFEQPAAYLDWAELRGHEVSMTKVYLEDPLPSSAMNYDMLIVMGGPQSPDEDLENFPYYHPLAEIALLQDFIQSKKPIVGVCLGAQLLGVAYGAAFEHSPEREIGVFPIELTQEGLADAHLSTFEQGLSVGHWHGDMPGLTEYAQVLATSQGCPRQIVKYADNHYGFQCHLEFNQEVLPDLIAAEEDLVKMSQELTYVQNETSIMLYDYSQMNQSLFAFLDSLTHQNNKK
ncbi:glutamine amidotransferase-related protein [Streptococcus loxodontisalivarius]|uniref:GMP synthase (Glutamine-hydrolyzing) n=1 Tax=Streptococcus loxodontisalivarius TaxID=1349415 RepID=A0ABS2PQV1_9STRE|nr:gamma-glutamyl-gamma-aminobutyrate hydrolase family protein [Streptococcus loxodontisalivarius]MBM7641752.1 GMP synthase (glutamine-hydrolyzing) [Streptococcus loxodontisalivarius]